MRRERIRNSSSSKQTGPPLDAKFKDIFAVCCVVPPPTLQVATWVNCVGRRNHRHRCSCHCCYWCCCCWRLVASFLYWAQLKTATWQLCTTPKRHTRNRAKWRRRRWRRTKKTISLSKVQTFVHPCERKGSRGKGVVVGVTAARSQSWTFTFSWRWTKVVTSH